MTLEELQHQLATLDDGVLKQGSHPPGREFCALEFESQVRGRSWSDQPVTLPDLRPLNDGPWSSDEARTEALLPVMVALWDWAEWPEARRLAWSERIVIETVRQIKTLADVRTAAAATVAWAAARAAAAAAVAAQAKADNVLRRACRIWIEAARHSSATNAGQSSLA